MIHLGLVTTIQKSYQLLLLLQRLCWCQRLMVGFSTFRCFPNTFQALLEMVVCSLSCPGRG